MAFNNNNNDNTYHPFWDWARSFDPAGAGVDHPTPGPANWPWGAAPPPPPPPPPHFHHHQHPDGGPSTFGPPGGFGWGFRGGRRGRHGHRHERPDGREREDRSRTASPEGERTDAEAAEAKDEAGEPRVDESSGEGRRRRHGRCGGGGPRGWGHHRGAWGGPGRRGPHPPPPPPRPFPPGMFNAPMNLSALFQAAAEHPLAQAFMRSYTGAPGAERSGETLVDADFDAESSFTPPVDTFSTEASYVLHVALPGAKKEDVGINWDADKGTLNIAGVVYRKGDEEFLKTLTKGERKVGVFDRTVKLPLAGEEKEEIDADGISAKLEDGVLVVTVPKAEKEWTEVKRVDID